MNSKSTSIKVFGLYLASTLGIGLIFIPEFMLDLFKLSYGEDLWLARMIGLLASVIGVFYFFIAKYNLEKIYNLTVIIRYFAAFFMTVLWISGEVEATILIIASIDALGATWTMILKQN